MNQIVALRDATKRGITCGFGACRDRAAIQVIGASLNVIAAISSRRCMHSISQAQANCRGKSTVRVDCIPAGRRRKAITGLVSNRLALAFFPNQSSMIVATTLSEEIFHRISRAGLSLTLIDFTQRTQWIGERLGNFGRVNVPSTGRVNVPSTINL